MTSQRVTLPQLLALRPELVSDGKNPERYVRQLVADRRIAFYNPTGGRLIFDLDEVDQFIEASRVAPSRPIPARTR